MEGNEDALFCLRYLRRLRRVGKLAATDFDAFLGTLQNEAATRGLGDECIELIIDIVSKNDLGSVKSINLIKCLVPMYNISDKSVKQMLLWCLSSVNEVPVTMSIMTVQWIIGLWDYQLVDKKSINIFYDVLFYVMLKKDKLDRHIARLIYVLTKPEDVTRRNVSRLLKIQHTRLSMQKHIMALLSLFKSYKPELVPEKITAVNIESVWRPIPETLRLGFQEAKARCEARNATHVKSRIGNEWTAVPTGTALGRSSKSKQSLVPSVSYFHFGSSIFREKDAKSLFDVSGIEELGKYQLTIDLPCNATSLLSNMAGYHLLTFTDFHYQSRFAYNLYNTLQKAFIFENGKFSKEEMDRLLDMTVEFSRYMQQGILVVNLFLDNYLCLNTGKHRLKLLSLMQWMTCISVPELQDKMSGHIRTMYYESGVEMKCEILAMLRMLIMNLFVNQGFDECRQTEPAPFLGQGPIDNLTDILPSLMETVEYLVTSGLNIHSYDMFLLEEALTLYEQLAVLELRSKMRTWTLAPRALIYGGFLSKSCAILSRVCSLLLRYREMNLLLVELHTEKRFRETTQKVTVYTRDIVTALWHKRAFSAGDISFLKKFSKATLDDFRPIDMDELLSITSHCAILPHKFTLSKRDLQIRTRDEMLRVSKYYFPELSKFLTLFAK